MSDLQDLHEQQGDQVAVFALNVPAFGESAQTLAAFTEQAGVTYPVLDHTSTSWLFSFTGNNTFPYPRDVIIDQDGVVVYLSNNYDAQGMRTVIDALLATP